MVILQTISVAGIDIEFSGTPSSRAMLEQRYGAFAIPQTSSPEARIELDLYPPPEDPWAGQPLTVQADEGEFQLLGKGLQATIADDATRAYLWAPAVERSVDGVLRYVLSQRLMARGGILAHASALAIHGQAWVFPGASGVGKSTISRHLSGDLLGDEAIALLVQKDEVVAHATPYWRATPACKPVAALLFPKQGNKNHWDPLSAARAVGRLLSCAGPLLPSANDTLMSCTKQIVTTLTPHLAEITLSSIPAITDWLQPQISEYSTLPRAVRY